MAVLAKRQTGLQLAIRQGQENPVDRAIRVLKAAHGDFICIIERTAAKEEWTLARRQERLQEIRELVETLVRTARATRWDTAVAAWLTQVCSLVDEVLESARQVIDDKSTDYTLDEVDEELQLMAQHGQWMRKLLAASKRDGFAGHPDFEEVQRAVLGEVQAQVMGAESWLEKVRADLYAAAVAIRRTRAVDNRRTRAEMTRSPCGLSRTDSRPVRRRRQDLWSSPTRSGWPTPSQTWVWAGG
jgi:hypothetical protein